MATIGVFCGDITELDDRLPGGGANKRTQRPVTYGNRAQAMREDEEIVTMVEAIFTRFRKK